MTKSNALFVKSPIGRQETDSTGSPVGAVRMDAGQPHANIGTLLQEYINPGNEEAWETIKKKTLVKTKSFRRSSSSGLPVSTLRE